MKQRAAIGIEISAEEVRGACVKTGPGGAQLVAVGSVPTPPNAMDKDGMLVAQSIGDAVRHLCMQLDPRVQSVVIGMTGCNQVARVMEIPPVPDSEVRSVLRGEMDHYRILPSGQSAFDFYRLPDSRPLPGAEEDEPLSRVLLIGAEERLVASYRAIVDASSLNVAAVEPGAIAVLRALHPMLSEREAVATINVSASGTDILITQKGDLQFYRRIDTGVPELRNAAAADAGAHQEVSLVRGGLLAPPDDELFEQPPVTEVEEPAAESINRQAVSLLMTEVQRSIDYFVREYPQAGDMMEVRFAIDAVDAVEMFGVMTQYLRSEAQLASAGDTLIMSPEASAIMRGPEVSRYTVAVGLALRGQPGYDSAPTLDLAIGDRVIVERRMAPRVMMASLAASGVILAGTVVAALIVGGQISRATRTLTQTKTELTTLTREHAAKVARLERQKNLTSAIFRRDKPIREAIDFVSAAVARRASLTSLVVDANGGIFVSGEAEAPRTVADIMDTINLSPRLEPIRLNNLTRSEVDKLVTVKFDLQTALAGQKPAGTQDGGGQTPQGGT